MEYGRTENSAIARHAEQSKHEIDWTNAECLQTEKKIVSTKNPRKCIKANKNRCMNLNNGFGVTIMYGKGKEEWLRRGRGGI